MHYLTYASLFIAFFFIIHYVSSFTAIFLTIQKRLQLNSSVHKRVQQQKERTITKFNRSLSQTSTKIESRPKYSTKLNHTQQSNGPPSNTWTPLTMTLSVRIELNPRETPKRNVWNEEEPSTKTSTNRQIPNRQATQ